MSAYTPGDSGSPDAEPTRRLRTGDTRDGRTGLGRIASMKHLYIRFRAAWRSMKNPDASPEEMGYVPHLRSRLIAILVMRGLPHHWSVHLRHPAELPLSAG